MSRIWAIIVGAALLVTHTAIIGAMAYADSFFSLRSGETGREYGPFRASLGADVIIGHSHFTLVSTEQSDAGMLCTFRSAQTDEIHGPVALHSDAMLTLGKSKFTVVMPGEPPAANDSHPPMFTIRRIGGTRILGPYSYAYGTRLTTADQAFALESSYGTMFAPRSLLTGSLGPAFECRNGESVRLGDDLYIVRVAAPNVPPLAALAAPAATPPVEEDTPATSAATPPVADSPTALSVDVPAALPVRLGAEREHGKEERVLHEGRRWQLNLAAIAILNLATGDSVDDVYDVDGDKGGSQFGAQLSLGGAKGSLGMSFTQGDYEHEAVVRYRSGREKRQRVDTSRTDIDIAWSSVIDMTEDGSFGWGYIAGVKHIHSEKDIYRHELSTRSTYVTEEGEIDYNLGAVGAFCIYAPFAGAPLRLYASVNALVGLAEGLTVDVADTTLDGMNTTRYIDDESCVFGGNGTVSVQYEPTTWLALNVGVRGQEILAVKETTDGDRAFEEFQGSLFGSVALKSW